MQLARQIRDPYVFWQMWVVGDPHPPLFVAHSLISKHWPPVTVAWNPGKQGVHNLDPSVLMQKVDGSQPPLFAAHSFISVHPINPLPWNPAGQNPQSTPPPPLSTNWQTVRVSQPPLAVAHPFTTWLWVPFPWTDVPLACVHAQQVRLLDAVWFVVVVVVVVLAVVWLHNRFVVIVVIDGCMTTTVQLLVPLFVVALSGVEAEVWFTVGHVQLMTTVWFCTVTVVITVLLHSWVVFRHTGHFSFVVWLNADAVLLVVVHTVLFVRVVLPSVVMFLGQKRSAIFWAIDPFPLLPLPLLLLLLLQFIKDGRRGQVRFAARVVLFVVFAAEEEQVEFMTTIMNVALHAWFVALLPEPDCATVVFAAVAFAQMAVDGHDVILGQILLVVLQMGHSWVVVAFFPALFVALVVVALEHTEHTGQLDTVAFVAFIALLLLVAVLLQLIVLVVLLIGEGLATPVMLQTHVLLTTLSLTPPLLLLLLLFVWLLVVVLGHCTVALTWSVWLFDMRTEQFEATVCTITSGTRVVHPAVPFPVWPVGHAPQTTNPGTLIQAVGVTHPPLLIKHSLISTHDSSGNGWKR
jgi:hypothetical protein